MVISSSFPQSSINQSSNCQTLYEQGYLLLGAGYYREALICFDQAIAALPNHADSWFRRGDALTYLAHHQEALFSFDQALLLQPEHQQAWTFRGAVLIQLERYTEALDSCDRALDLDPNDSATWIVRGVALHRLKLYRHAYASYDRALGIEREPLSRQVIGPILSFFNRIWIQLFPPQPGRYSTRQKYSLIQAGGSTSNSGWDRPAIAPNSA